MTMPSEAVARTAGEAGRPERTPYAALVVLALLAFVLITAETMPAGLLPEIADGMRTTEGTVGLFVSAYALGTTVATVPAIALTRGFRRKPLFATGIVVFLLANSVTAVSTVVGLSLAARFVGGACSGILWGLFAVHALRISPLNRSGRALAIASFGVPLGIALGTPIGSWIGAEVDWRWAFGGLSLVTAVLLVLLLAVVPDVPGRRQAAALSPLRVLGIPGVLAILTVIFTWMLAHSTIYIYIAPYLRTAGNQLPVVTVLLVFGIASVAGLTLTGVLADRHLRALVLTSIGGFAAAGVVLLIAHRSPVAVLIATACWGLTFGGAATQLQTALGRASGDDVDLANAFLPVAFNVAIFGSGIVGAILLTVGDGLVLPVAMVLLSGVALTIAVAARARALPGTR